ncbi:uncharacterized protein LOC109832008 [Asparagus officinalis]|uniref:uncharacterized protein LOC109832008 n=1 Tax=Asparagus officinalis TaxID=4686 RepID=UPI00098E29D7|nr:uncharacterized protein LOC109832008 [Asparagus officinalis]
MWHCVKGRIATRSSVRETKKSNMGSSRAACRLLVLLLLVSIALAPYKALGLRNLDLALRRGAAEEPRDAKEADVVGFDAKKGSEAPSPSSFDLNGTSKRRVRRGSDPIHNRC